MNLLGGTRIFRWIVGYLPNSKKGKEGGQAHGLKLTRWYWEIASFAEDSMILLSTGSVNSLMQKLGIA